MGRLINSARCHSSNSLSLMTGPGETELPCAKPIPGRAGRGGRFYLIALDPSVSKLLNCFGEPFSHADGDNETL